MASEIHLETGTPVVLAVTAFHGLITSTTSGGWQSAKTDLTASRAEQFLLRAQVAWTTAITAGGYISFYVGFSSLSTAASGNPANLSGADAAWTGYSNDIAVASSHLQMVGVLAGSLSTSTTVPQVKDIGMFTPLDRYCMVIAINSSSQPLSTITTLNALTLIPLMDEAQ